MKYIRKDYSGVVPNGKILNQEVNSEIDTYSCKYINNKVGAVSIGNNSNNADLWVDVSNNLVALNKGYTRTINGMTLTVDDNNELVFNGTATADAQFDLTSFSLNKDATKITISGGNASSRCGVYFFNSSGNYLEGYRSNDGSVKTATIPNGTARYQPTILIPSGTNFINYKPYMKLEYGDTATPYSRYVSPHISFKNGNVYDELARPNKYSTAEQVIGTWTDGKPLYRKVIACTSPATLTATVVASFDKNNIIKNYYGLCTIADSSQKVPINFYYTNAYNIGTFITQSTGTITMKIGSEAYENQQTTITIEYTKSTD